MPFVIRQYDCSPMCAIVATATDRWHHLRSTRRPIALKRLLKNKNGCQMAAKCDRYINLEFKDRTTSIAQSDYIRILKAPLITHVFCPPERISCSFAAGT